MHHLLVLATHLCASSYFLFRLLTVCPFLPAPRPHQRRIGRLHFLILFLLILLPSFLTFASGKYPWLALSWFVASCTAIRFAYNAPLFDSGPVELSFLHYPRILLWRVDVASYLIFVLLQYGFIYSDLFLIKIITIILASGVIFVISLDIVLRLQAHLEPVSFKSVIATLFTSNHRAPGVSSAPPTVYDAPAYVLLSFHWVTPLVVTGRQRSLEASDVMPMSEPYLTHVSAYSRFLPFWDEQLRKAPNRRPSVVRALIKAFGVRLLLGGCLKIINDVCLFLSPVLLRYVIQYLQERSSDSWSVKTGILLSTALFATYITQTASFNQYFNINSTVQALVRGALISTVYRKSCRLSSNSRNQYTSGQIQNLMSNDSQAVADVVLYIHMFWSSMEQIAVANVLLISLLGFIPAVSGVLFLLLVIPLQSFLVANVKSARERASSFTDERVKTVSEVIKGIKLVKLYAWEFSFVRRILGHRAKELDELRKMNIFQAWSGVTSSGIPTLMSLVVFSVFVAMGNVLDASVIFPAISLFNVLRPAMIIFPYILVNCARASASLSRLQKFLTADELVPLEESAHAVDQNDLVKDGLDLLATEAAFSWDPSSSRPTISSASFAVPQGSLVAIVGPTGGGKSTLLSGMLGETPIVNGRAGLLASRKVAFCDQIAFIQNATVRENILFGKLYNESRYRDTIRRCCLEPDLEILPAGDETEIGGRGVNLSGGQRARISLARAVYSDADIYMLDDPLSAVDAHVGKSIFDNCIVDQLNSKTRILATNQIHLAASDKVDMIIVVKNGSIVEFGKREELMSSPTSEFSKLSEAVGEARSKGDQTENKDEISIDLPNHEANNNAPSNDSMELSEAQSNSSPNYGAAEAGRLIRKEAKEKGRVRLEHYLTYSQSMGIFQWVLPILILTLMFNGFQMGVNVWMSYWSDTDPSSETTQSRMFNLAVFFMLGLISLFSSTGLQFCVAFGSIRASVLSHEKLLLSVFGAPSSFFNTNPDGRIINRFTSDMDKIDQSIATTLQTLSRLLISLLFSLGLIIWVMPPFIFIAIPVVALCMYVQEFYRKTSVDLRRLEALARSPLYSHFGETLDGVVTIRAYRDVPRATHINNLYADQLIRATFASSFANRWLALRLEGLGAVLIFFATFLVVLAPLGQISAGLAGLILTYTVQMLGSLTWTVRQFTDTESQMSAVERIAEYSNSSFPQEEEGGLEALLKEMQKKSQVIKWNESRGLVSKDKMMQLSTLRYRHTRWPKKGVVQFENLEMRYRKDLAPALRNVSLTIDSGEHIGIVGRTGAGKSSAIQCLFRLYELEKGLITIDGVDISKLRLNYLRSSLGIIPQEPVCFSGSIRTNLDMFGEYGDEEVQKALDACGLQGTLRENISLDDVVHENGSNLSVGQRQLLCLGRALLKDSQVLVLDEATSNVSNEVDEKIQKTLRDEMSHCTILTVAHRLNTVMNSDRIVVMDKGRIAEVGKPSELLKGPSMLGKLVDETGPSTAAHLRELAFEADRIRNGERRYYDKGKLGTGTNDQERGAEKIRLGIAGDKMGVEDESLSGMIRAVFEELRSTLTKMNRKDVVLEMTKLGSHNASCRNLVSSVIERLSLAHESMAEGNVENGDLNRDMRSVDDELDS